MDNKKKNGMRSRYDEDMDWLDDDDDYLDDGGLIGSLLFGDKKKKEKRRDPEPERKADKRPEKKPEKKTQKNISRPVKPEENYDEYYHEDSRARRVKSEARAKQRQTGQPVADRAVDRGPVKRTQGTVPRTQSNQSTVQRPSKAAQRPRRSIQSTGSSSVDNLLREVDNIETDVQTRHEELRREAWERTQRNVAKAKAEVERLELEREQNAREEARKLKVQQELERRQQMKEAEKKEEPVEEDNKITEPQESDAEVVETATQPVEEHEQKTEPADILEKNTEPVLDDEVEEAAEAEPVEEASTVSSRRTDDMLDMDELERIEKDIDEDKLSYSESDTADLGLGDIGKALGFDEVELEDDEEEPEEDEESDSEKFFRENLLDEADPKVVNPERKKLNISTRVWAIAFFVLLALFILICIIYVKNYARMKYNEMDINEISADQILVNDGVKDATKGYRAIALYGVDSRDSNMNSGTNSDSIMIVSINESTKEIKLVSVYRDTLMEIASGSMDTTQKVNYAYQLGGAVTAINTLNTNLDLNITDYVAVDFSAMASIIDAVGGVDVKVIDEEVNNFNKNLAEQISLSGKYSSGITEAGEYTLDGQQAVAYSRIRSTGQGDITRTERQRIVLMKVIDKLLSADTGSLDSFVDVSFKCISTSLNKDDIHALVKNVAGYKVVDTAGFPFAYEAKELSDKGNCLVAADMASNVEALHEYLYGADKYVISGTVKQISSNIESISGVKSQKVKVTTEAPGDGISDGSDEDGDLRTITTPPKGMIVEE